MKSDEAAPTFWNQLNGVPIAAPVVGSAAAVVAAPDTADDEVPDPVRPPSRPDNDVEPVEVWLAASVSP